MPRHLAPAESTFGSWRGTLGGLTRAAAFRELVELRDALRLKSGDVDRTAPSARERGDRQGRHPSRPIRHTQERERDALGATVASGERIRCGAGCQGAPKRGGLASYQSPPAWLLGAAAIHGGRFERPTHGSARPMR